MLFPTFFSLQNTR